MNDPRLMDMHSVAPGSVQPDYEDMRRDVLRKYNALLLDAERHLQVALNRVEATEIEAQAGETRDLTREILALIEYLSQARL